MVALDTCISFICGDDRQIYLANLFSENGYKTYTYGISSSLLSPNCSKCNHLREAIKSSSIIIFPYRIDCLSLSELEDIIPLLINKTVFGGCIPISLKNTFNNNHIQFYDYFKVDYVNKLNAIATAEGSIYYAIGNSNINLHNNNSLVIGYGNCGSVLAHKLYGLGSNVTVACRNPYACACAFTNSLKYVDINILSNVIYNYPFVFNTVPALVLDRQVLSRMNKNSVIIDIASSPF